MADSNQDVAQAWKGFDDTRRKALLAKMNPDQKKNLRAALEGTPTAPDTSKLTTNSIDPKTGKGYGLYRMLPSSVQGYTDASQEIQVPYNHVKAAQDAGLHLHPDEEPRFQKDSTHEGQGPTILERAGSAVQSGLEPSEGVVGELPVVPGMDLNAVKATGRTVAAAPGYLEDLATALFHGVQGKDPHLQEILPLIDPAQMPEQMYKQFQEDFKKSPNLAVDNLKGTLVGMGLVAAATHGATKAPGAISDLPSLKKAGEGVRSFVREQVEMPQRIEKTVHKFGEESERVRQQHQKAEEETEKAKGKIDVINKKKAQTHAEALENHNKEVAKIAKEHRKKVAQKEQEHADALKKHQDETKATQAKNVQALQEHLQTADKIAKDNQTGMDAIKARQAGEQQVEQETAEFRKRIADAKTKAIADNNTGWNDLRKKNAGFSTDISNLQKVTERAADQADPATSVLFKKIIKGEQPDLPTLTNTSGAVRYVDAAGNPVDRQGMSPVSFDQKVANGEIKSEPIVETVNPDDPGYADLYESQYGEPPPVGGGPAQFNRLQRWYSYISNKMYGGGRVEGGLYNAYKMVRSAINDAMQDIAKQAGSTADLAKVRKSHTELMEAFSDSPNEPRTVASAYEKAKVPESVKETTEAEWGKKLENYDPEITKLGESITKAKEGLEQLPSEVEARKMIKPIPQPPMSAPLPVAPVAPPPLAGPEYPIPPTSPEAKPYGEPKSQEPLPDVEKINQENITFLNDALRRYGKIGPWVFRLLTGGILEHLIKGESSAFGGTLMVGQGGLVLLTKILRGPGALEWLARPSAEDLKVIATLPPQDAARLRQAFKALADEEVRQNPEKASIKIAPIMAGWLAGGSASKGDKKKDGKPSIDDVKTKAQELQMQMHKSGLAPAPKDTPPPAPGPQSSNQTITHKFNPTTGEIEAA